MLKTEAKHTPGPWTTDPDDLTRWVWIGTFALQAPSEEDALLIAAAPELLVALQTMVNNYVACYGDEGDDAPEAVKAGIAAIAKATGGALKAADEPCPTAEEVGRAVEALKAGRGPLEVAKILNDLPPAVRVRARPDPVFHRSMTPMSAPLSSEQVCEHTRGPWRVEHAPDGHTYIRARDSSIVAKVSGTNALAGGTLEGNAALIAAAPSIVRALQRLTHPAADDSDVDFALSILHSLKGGA